VVNAAIGGAISSRRRAQEDFPDHDIGRVSGSVGLRTAVWGFRSESVAGWRDRVQSHCPDCLACPRLKSPTSISWGPSGP
jgi:hypothetical protein